jgi:hypothetical protein
MVLSEKRMFYYISYVQKNNTCTYGHVEVKMTDEMNMSWVSIVRGMTNHPQPIIIFISAPYAESLLQPLRTGDATHGYKQCQNISYAVNNEMHSVEICMDPDDHDGLAGFFKKYMVIRAVCPVDVMPVILHMSPPYKAPIVGDKKEEKEKEKISPPPALVALAKIKRRLPVAPKKEKNIKPADNSL